MARALGITWDGGLVSAVRLNQHGEMSFIYAPEWIAARSSLPRSTI